ncbi:MAG: acyl-CoA dehydrogenase domain-containing protein, partial [Methylocystaceae bacterium]
YEGANGIQALDLVGRKLPRDGGRAIMAYFKDTAEFLNPLADDDAMKPFATPVKAALDDLQKATMWLMQNAMAKPDNAGAASYDYMHLFGRVALGVIWVKIAQAAIEKKAREPHEAARMDAKLLTARFYMERMLPETSLRLTRISTGADTMMSLPEEMF